MSVKAITKADAKAAGLKRYFTGLKCKHGHKAERLVSTGCCVKCHAKAYKAYSKNGGRAKELERKRRYNSDNKGRINALVSHWRAGNLNATPAWFGEFDELAIAEAFDLRATREAQTGFGWQVDHMLPLKAKTVCGLHCGANIQVIPQRHNLEKGNRLIMTEPGEWIRYGL